MFDEAWSLYPHHATRSKKAPSRAIWHAITTDGYNCVGRVDKSPIKLGTVQETEQALLEAIKAMCMCIPSDELKFVPGFQVWVHQGRFMDFDEDERKRLAEQFDENQATMERLKKDGKLRVIK